MKNMSPFVCFVHFQFICSFVAWNTTSMLCWKISNADFVPLEPLHQIIGKSVCVCFLWEMLRAHRQMLAGFPMHAFWFYKIDPLSPSPLLFGVSFTIKRYEMKQYLFLFVFEHCYNQKQHISQAYCFGSDQLRSKSHQQLQYSGKSNSFFF